MTDADDYWKPWPESNTVQGFPLAASDKPRWGIGADKFKDAVYGRKLYSPPPIDWQAVEKAWREVEAAVLADIARERGVPVERLRVVYGEGALCDSVTVEVINEDR